MKQFSPPRPRNHCCWRCQHCKQGLHSENLFSLTGQAQRLKSKFLKSGISLENTLRSGFYFKMVPETKTLCFLLTFLHCMKWMKCKGKPASKWPPRLKLWKSESLCSLQLTSEQHMYIACQPTDKNLIFDFQKKSRSHLREKSSPERR